MYLNTYNEQFFYVKNKSWTQVTNYYKESLQSGYIRLAVAPKINY